MAVGHPQEGAKARRAEGPVTIIDRARGKWASPIFSAKGGPKSGRRPRFEPKKLLINGPKAQLLAV